jgi:uncharacterized protein (TIGR03067 family)
MTSLILTTTLASLLLGPDATAHSELEKYQGMWVLIFEEFQGVPVPPDQLPDLSYTVQGDKVRFTSNGKDHSATVRLDPSKTPRTYDLVRDDGGPAMRGIYTWDDGNIKVCSSDDQRNRPTGFETGPGSKRRIRVWMHK